jgi:hypothetical protein
MVRLLVENPEEISNTNYLETDKFYLPRDPCRCSVDGLKQLLAPLNGPGLTFSPAYRVGLPQTITLKGHIPDSDACRLADGTSPCERLSFKFSNKETLFEITKFPHKGLSYNELTFNFQPQGGDPIGLHEVLVTA